MKKRFSLLILLLLPFLMPLPEAGAQGGMTDTVNVYYPGRIRLKLKHELLDEVGRVAPSGRKSAIVETGIRRLDDLNRKYGVKSIRRVFPFSLRFEEKHRKYGLHLWYELEYDGDTDPRAMAGEYARLEEVMIAKPVYVKVPLEGDQKPVVVMPDTLHTRGVRLTTPGGSTLKSALADSIPGVSFNDPFLPDQWHYYNDGRIGTKGVDIDLLKAWTKATGDTNVIVSVVDGGIDLEHEDLKDNLWTNWAELNGEEGKDDDGNGYVDDIHGYNFVYNSPVVTPHHHGTHVAGTVGAVNNNGIGVAGVAGGDGSGNGVRLMSCQVYDERGGAGNYAAAIVYGADNGAVISQNSWGYKQPGFFEPEVYDAVRYFIAEAGQYEGSPMRGGVFIAAAGNDGREQTHYPGAFDEAVGVAATGPTGQPAPYSNYGDWVDISAPGGDQAYFGEKGGVLSTLPDNQYGYYQGTSMATPHVSGVAALIVARFGGKDFRAEDLKKILLNATTPFLFDSQGKFGSGNLNALLALEKNEFIAPDPITDLRADEIFHNEVRLKWTVPRDSDDFQPAYFYLAMDDEPITAANFGQQQVFRILNYYEAGTELAVTVTGLLKLTDYWFAIKSSDRHGNISDISNILKVTTTDEPHFHAPQRSFEYIIDVRDNPVRTATFPISNIGKGIIYWNSYTVNENPWWIPLEEWHDHLDSLKKSASGLKSAKQTLYPLTGTKGEEFAEYWKDDKTLYYEGYTYVYADPTALVGSNNINTGLIHATRFQTTEGDFHLTHLEMGLFTVTREPVYIEIRKGSDKLEEARPVLVQKYIPDTTGVLRLARVPLARTLHFDKDEYFWVMLYFSKREPKPLLVHKSIYFPKTFYVSFDNGNTFTEQWQLLGNVVPYLYAYSTGEDMSYTFIHPTEGELHEGEKQDIRLTVDASRIRNGRHIATVGIRTSDRNVPGVGIEVKVTVRGQRAEADLKEQYDYDVYIGRDNHLLMPVKNIGLDSLRIWDITDDATGESVRDFTDTVRIGVHDTRDVSFVYTPTVTGILTPRFTLHTNIGELQVKTQMRSMVAPVIGAYLDRDSLSLATGQKDRVHLTLTNVGPEGTFLNYDLDHYDPARLTNGALSCTFGYVLSTSDDAVHPLPSQWIALEHYGLTPPMSKWYRYVHLPNGFPFYNKMVDYIIEIGSGELFIYGLGSFDFDNPSLRDRAKGVIAPLHLNISGELVRSYYHDFGDKYVFTYVMQLRKRLPTGWYQKLKNITYQVVLYRDGTVEFNYLDVDALQEVPELKYTVGIQGPMPGQSIFYHTYHDTTNYVHSGLSLRFIPNRDLPVMTISSVRKGMLGRNDTATFAVDIDPALYGHHLPAGNYETPLVVYSNADSSAYELPLTVEVRGIADLSAGDTLLFGLTNLGYDTLQYLRVDNAGSGTARIISVTFSDPAFSVDDTLTLVPGYANIMLPVRFTPAHAGTTTATMTLVFDNGHSEQVWLRGTGRPDPVYTVEIEQDISRTLRGGDTVSIPFRVISHDNGADLDLVFHNTVISKATTPGIPAASQPKPDTLQLYGYTWQVSDSTRSFFKWKDVKADPRAVAYNIQRNEPQRMALPFRFPFYGEMFDTIWISMQGYVSVFEPENDDFHLEFRPGDGQRGMIAPFFSDFIPDGPNSRVWVLEEDDRVYVLWDGYRGSYAGGAGGAVYFQLELVRNGSIYFHYLSVSNFTFTLQYGLESPDEREKLETPHSWILKWSVVADTTTLAITPPLRLRMNSGDTRDHRLLLSAEHLYRSGVYHDTLELSTNSLTQPRYLIPVTLTVEGTPKVEAPDSLVWEEEIFVQNKKIRKRFVLTNTGHDVAEVNTIVTSGLTDARLYDDKGEEIKRTSLGTLFRPLQLAPWDRLTLELEISLPSLADQTGTVTFEGNFPSVAIPVKARVVSSPVFTWDAADQHFLLNNTAKGIYRFTLRNEGETDLHFRVIPAIIPSEEGEDTPPRDTIVEELGRYQFLQPTTVDSLAVDSKEKADGYETPLIEVWLAFANDFTAPPGGFYLTHIKVNAIFKQLDEYIRIQVWKGGDKPMEGELVYQQDFVTDRYVTEQWVYFPLKHPLNFNEGERFFLVVIPPYASRYLGYDIAPNQQAVEHCWAANYQSWAEHWNWQQYKNLLRIYKIRALTAAGENLWLELDPLEGVIPGGGSREVVTSVDPVLAGKGTHQALVKVNTNDVNHPHDHFSLTAEVNGPPDILFRPNLYHDTVVIVETEDKTLNYLFEDPEQEEVEVTLDDHQQAVRPVLERTGPNTLQLRFHTGYSSAGLYRYTLTFTDEAGNMVKDELLVKVLDKNRPPVLNPDYARITINMADEEVLTVDPAGLFTDPDGDVLQIYAGNYTPEVLDMALGNHFIDLHPLQPGVGFVVFAADDGHEGGFVAYGVYVQVINDAGTSATAADALVHDAEVLVSHGGTFALYPNPVQTGHPLHLIYKLDTTAHIRLEVYDVQGIRRSVYEASRQQAGIHSTLLDISGLRQGIYFCRLMFDGHIMETKKIIIR